MYRADTIDITPTRPYHVLLVVEVVSPGSETTERGLPGGGRVHRCVKVSAPFPVEVDLGRT
jgi:hypothetical protein